jgi:signal transduction histidine kinase
VQVIRRGGDHLLSLIEGTLDIARIESGRLALELGPMHFADAMDELVRLFELQAAERGLRFPTAAPAPCPRWCVPTRSGCARS